MFRAHSAMSVISKFKFITENAGGFPSCTFVTFVVSSGILHVISRSVLAGLSFCRDHLGRVDHAERGSQSTQDARKRYAVGARRTRRAHRCRLWIDGSNVGDRALIRSEDFLGAVDGVCGTEEF